MFFSNFLCGTEQYANVETEIKIEQHFLSRDQKCTGVINLFFLEKGKKPVKKFITNAFSVISKSATKCLSQSIILQSKIKVLHHNQIIYIIEHLRSSNEDFALDLRNNDV